MRSQLPPPPCALRLVHVPHTNPLDLLAGLGGWLSHSWSVLWIDQNWSKRWNLLANLGFANPNQAGNLKPHWFSFEVPSPCQWDSHHWLGTCCIQQFGFPNMAVTWATWIGSSFSGNRATGKGRGPWRSVSFEGSCSGEWKSSLAFASSRGFTWDSKPVESFIVGPTQRPSWGLWILTDSQPNRNYAENGSHGWS